MRFDALRRLAGIAGRPATAIDLAQDRFSLRLLAELALHHGEVLEHLLAEAKLRGQPVNDGVIIVRFKDRLHHLLAPLDGAVGGRARARTFHLRRDRQQIGVVLAPTQRDEIGRMGIGNDQQFKLLEAFFEFRLARHRIAAMAEDHGCLDGIGLIHVLLVICHCVEPAGRGDAGHLHHLLVSKAREHVVVRHLPDARPMPPCTFDQAVIERQRGDIEPQIRRALHIGMAAEDIGARARSTDIAGGEQQDTGGPHIGGADGVLRLPHAPDQRRRLFLGKFLGDLLELLAGNAGEILDRLRIIFLHFSADLLHAVDAAGDEVLVLPAILEDVPENAPEHRNIAARTDTHIFIGMGRRAGHAGINDNHIRFVDLLAGEQMLQRDRMRFRRIAAHDDHGLGIADIVVGIGLRPVAPGIGHACHCGGMADARLVVDVVGAPEGGKLAEEISPFIGEFG